MTTRRAAAAAHAGARCGWAVTGVLTGLVVASSMTAALLARTRDRLEAERVASPWLDRVLQYDVDWYLDSLRRLSSHVPAGPWAGVLVGATTAVVAGAVVAVVVRRRRA